MPSTTRTTRDMTEAEFRAALKRNGFRLIMGGWIDRPDSAQESAAIVEAYDLSRAATVVDLGVGRGALLTAIPRAHEHLTGIVCDQPSVVPGAERHLADAGLSSRAVAIAVDFFRAVPGGGHALFVRDRAR